MKRFPLLSKSARRGLLALECIVVVVGLICYLFPLKSGETMHFQDGKEGADKPAFRGKKSAYIYQEQEEQVETFPFDPNTADSTTLLRLGLAPWQVRSIYRYRAKHGRYHTPEEFKRLPGMTLEMWNRLGPQVRIAKEFRYLSESSEGARENRASLAHATNAYGASAASSTHQSIYSDTIKFPKKFAKGTVIDINMADTSLLKKIPGIASYRARKIVEYRDKLGGFVKVEQVMESCDDIPGDVLDWMTVTGAGLSKVNVNKLPLKVLMRHPYISFAQARDIVDYRNIFGPLKSVDDLYRMESFNPQKIERLQPYLEF